MVLPVKGHGAMHQDVQENTQRPAVHLREGGGGEVSKDSGGPPARPAHQREASASEGHLPLVSGGKGVTLQEALRLRGEVPSITSPWQGQPQTQEQWRGHSSGTGRGGWLGAGKGDGNQKVSSTELD